ncbi:MAG: hypothetical protein Q4E50_03935 [Tissierellia bacterium]|nr:hypothetical protein [Tissierellia bacterium]
MKNISKMRTLYNVVSIVSMLSFIVFILHHYQYINFQIFAFEQKGYFTLAFIALLGLIISDILEVKITLASGKKLKVFSIIFNVITLGLLIAFVWYMYTLPIGFCPIRAIMNGTNGVEEVNFQ